jgi:hypothetical protein
MLRVNGGKMLKIIVEIYHHGDPQLLVIRDRISEDLLGRALQNENIGIRRIDNPPNRDDPVLVRMIAVDLDLVILDNLDIP